MMRMMITISRRQIQSQQDWRPQQGKRKRTRNEYGRIEGDSLNKPNDWITYFWTNRSIKQKMKEPAWQNGIKVIYRRPPSMRHIAITAIPSRGYYNV